MATKHIVISDTGLLSANGKTICVLPNTPMRLLKTYIQSVDHKLTEQEQKLAEKLVIEWYTNALDNFLSKPDYSW